VIAAMGSLINIVYDKHTWGDFSNADASENNTL